jgi:hypothetical protein
MLPPSVLFRETILMLSEKPDFRLVFCTFTFEERFFTALRFLGAINPLPSLALRRRSSHPQLDAKELVVLA